MPLSAVRRQPLLAGAQALVLGRWGGTGIYTRPPTGYTSLPLPRPSSGKTVFSNQFSALASGQLLGHPLRDVFRIGRGVRRSQPPKSFEKTLTCRQKSNTVENGQGKSCVPVEVRHGKTQSIVDFRYPIFLIGCF